MIRSTEGKGVIDQGRPAGFMLNHPGMEELLQRLCLLIRSGISGLPFSVNSGELVSPLLTATTPWKVPCRVMLYS